MQRRAALVLVVITPALLMSSCKSSNKSKLTTQPKVSLTAVAPATTAPARSASATPLPLAPATSAPATSAPASAPPSPSTTPSVAVSPLDSGVPTNLDPCQLVTQSEASKLAGATFGPGEEETGSGNGKNCVYGSQTANVFTVAVGQASSATEALAEWTQAQAQVQSAIATQVPPGVHFNLDTANAAGIGDKAANVTGNVVIEGKTIAFSGIYVLKGSVFFAITDLVLGPNPPTASAMQAQAMVTLGRV